MRTRKFPSNSLQKLAKVSDVPKLVQSFVELVSETDLVPLLPVMQGLMRFRPAERMSASDALKLLHVDLSIQ